MPVVNRVSTQMGARRKTAAAIIRQTGISRAAITGLYRGTAMGITWRNLGRLCEALECQPGDLLRYIPDGDDRRGAIGPAKPAERGAA